MNQTPHAQGPEHLPPQVPDPERSHAWALSSGGQGVELPVREQESVTRTEKQYTKSTAAHSVTTQVGSSGEKLGHCT